MKQDSHPLPEDGSGARKRAIASGRRRPVGQTMMLAQGQTAVHLLAFSVRTLCPLCLCGENVVSHCLHSMSLKNGHHESLLIAPALPISCRRIADILPIIHRIVRGERYLSPQASRLSPNRRAGFWPFSRTGPAPRSHRLM